MKKKSKNRTQSQNELKAALAAFKSGQFDKVRKQCQELLQRQPEAIEPAYLMAQAYYQQTAFGQARKTMEKALSLAPNNAKLHDAMAWVLMAMNDMDQATRHFDQAISIDQQQAATLIGKADALMHEGQWVNATFLYGVVLPHVPLNADIFHNRGYAFEQCGRLMEALGHYSRALTIKPDYPEALSNRGNVLFSMQRYAEALAQYDKAISIRPDYAAAYNNKANTLISMKRIDEAVECLHIAIGIQHDYIEAYNNLGFALQKAGRHTEAMPHLERALELSPDYAEAHNNLGHSQHKLKQFDKAMNSYQSAIDFRPGYAEAIWNRGLIKLLLGDMPSGWCDMEKRWQKSSYQKQPGPKDRPQWTGEPLRGRFITVFIEQGFGDTIQMCRYLLLLLEAGADVTFACPRIIHRLISTLSPQIKLKSSILEGEPGDFHTTIFSLPTVFQTSLDTIPNPVPYLLAEQRRVEKWRKRIGEHGFKVAISWQGNPAGDVDLGRSIPLAELAPLSTIPDVRLISIQYEHGMEQLENLPSGMEVEVLHGFNAGPDGFVDTAAVMQSVDLVITTDSAPAHLAGALGVPVWTLLMEVPDWRWLLDRDDSPWYPTMRLFRQSVSGDWRSVVNEVRQALIQVSLT